MSVQIQFRRDTQANWESENPILAEGELGLITDTSQYKIGNGVDAWLDLPLVVITPTNNVIDLEYITDPSAPSAGHLKIYARDYGNRIVPKVIGPSGVDYPLQSALWTNANYLWQPTNVTGGLWLGTVSTSGGTYATGLPTTTNLYTVQKRAIYSNVVTTANQILGVANNELLFFIGNTAGQGGFFFYARFGFDAWNNGGRFFAGMHVANTIVTGQPSAANNSAGFAHDATTDAGVIQFLTRDASGFSKISTGITLGNNKGYDVFMFCAPNSNEISFRIQDITTGTVFSGSTTTNTPVANTMMRAGVFASNAALTPVNSIRVGVAKIYVEKDC